MRPACQGNYDFNDSDIDKCIIVCSGCGTEFELLTTGKIYNEGE